MKLGREVRFGLLLSEDESVALTRLAEDEGGLSQGAMVRKLIRTEARRRGLWPDRRVEAINTTRKCNDQL